jgi:prefoldin subunit 5
MRTKKEIIEEINQVNTLINNLIMDIGEGYARMRISNDNYIVPIINQKIEALKKAEAQMNLLEQELGNTPD